MFSKNLAQAFKRVGSQIASSVVAKRAVVGVTTAITATALLQTSPVSSALSQLTLPIAFAEEQEEQEELSDEDLDDILDFAEKHQKTSLEYIQDNDYPEFQTESESPIDSTSRVVRVNGKNFNTTAMDESKDVFVEYFSPSCELCAQYSVILEAIADAFEGVPTISIGKMDGYANYVPGVLQANEEPAYPTFKIFPAGPAKRDQLTEATSHVDTVRAHNQVLYRQLTDNDNDDVELDFSISKFDGRGVGDAFIMFPRNADSYIWDEWVDFIHENATHKFDKEQIKDKLATIVPDVVATLVTRPEIKDIDVLRSPCKDQWIMLLQTISLHSVGAAIQDDVMDSHSAFEQCTVKYNDDQEKFMRSLD